MIMYRILWLFRFSSTILNTCIWRMNRIYVTMFKFNVTMFSRRISFSAHVTFKSNLSIQVYKNIMYGLSCHALEKLQKKACPTSQQLVMRSLVQIEKTVGSHNTITKTSQKESSSNCQSVKILFQIDGTNEIWNILEIF